MMDMSTDTALLTATQAALQAIKATRARGQFGNTAVYHAIATCGISQADAEAVTEDAVRMAFEIHAEGTL